MWRVHQIKNKLHYNGFDSDYPIMRDAEKILRLLKINFDTKIVSARDSLQNV